MPGLAAVVWVFGMLTFVSGGSVLFGPESVSRIAGEVVGFVLWFNFLSAPFYILAGIGLWRGAPWGMKLAGWLALLCALVLLALILFIISGQAYELRTLLAMSFRFVFWGLLFLYARKRLSSSLVI